MRCDLCVAASRTRRYLDDAICWVADCTSCKVPMVVWREHGRNPPADLRSHMHAKLAEVVGFNFRVDEQMRKIPDHYHAHARPVPVWRGFTTTVWLDFDGVVKTGRHGTGPAVSSDLTGRLAALDVDVEWLSMRGLAAPASGSRAGFPVTWPVAAVPTDYPVESWLAHDAGWWKLQVLRRRSTASRPFVWVDDHLRHCPAAYEWAEGCGAPYLLIAPDPDVGITSADVDCMSRFVADHR